MSYDHDLPKFNSDPLLSLIYGSLIGYNVLFTNYASSTGSVYVQYHIINDI